MADVSVIGLGQLGLPLAVALATEFHVVGIDIDEKVVQDVHMRRVPPRIQEPNLEAMLDSVGSNLDARTSMECAAATDISIVLVQTPSKPAGGFSLQYVLDACAELGKALRRKEGYHVVVVSSTVMPGSCGGPVREALERASGRRVGENLGLCYSPEFVALGNVVRGFRRPDFVLVGFSDGRAGDAASAMYKRLCVNNSPMFRTSLINAELAKISVNCYVAMKITFANQLAELCEQIPGANVDEVTSVMGLDSRIKSKFLTGATAYGGPCFPRDIRAMTRVSGNAGLRLPLITKVGEMNLWQKDRLAAKVRMLLPSGGTVGILGLAYKPGIGLFAGGSAGVSLVDALRPVANVVAYDPLLTIGESVETAQACVDKSDVVVAVTRHSAFLGLKFRKGQIVLDCWRMLHREPILRQGAEYVAIGVGPNEDCFIS